MAYRGLTEDEELQLKEYKGVRIEHYNSKGLEKVTDTRKLDAEKLIARANLWLEYNEKMIIAVPIHKQINIALGLVDEVSKKNAYLKSMQDLLDLHTKATAMITKCNTLVELDQTASDIFSGNIKDPNTKNVN